jgi:hypothetical protein
LEIVANVTRIVEQAGIALTGTGFNQTPPMLSVDRGIHLNGVGKLGQKNFIFHKVGGRDFYKTLRKQYDVFVTAILLRASMVAGLDVEYAYHSHLYLL